MSFEYQRIDDPGEGLRLHLNENTAGCSPLVLAALREVTPEQVAFYPDYRQVYHACAAHLAVEPGELLLTNGLDEGILAVAMAAAEDRSVRRPEGIIVQPTFDMYAACLDAVGARVVAIPPHEDFRFPLDAVLSAITPATRAVFVTNPNNPTGQVVDPGDVAEVARRLPDDALLFVDEAYIEFGGESFLDRFREHPNVVIGRTFAKAYGLAALRVGAVVAQAPAVARLKRLLPPYSLNVFSAVGLRAALADRQFVEWYLSEVAESRRLLYAACERMKLYYWPSAANFVLVRVGSQAGRLVDELTARRIFIRDRSDDPGCDGCVRVTAGVVAHTRACIEAMEEVLCGGA